MRVGRTPLYPSYSERSHVDRQLAIIDGKRYYAENWRATNIPTFAALVDTLFTQNGLAFSQDLSDKRTFPFLSEAVRSPNTEIICNKEGHVLSIRCKRKNETRWIVPATAWERQIDENFLPDLRAIYSFFRSTKPTPGSLGQALIRRIWAVRRAGRHTAPSSLANLFLRSYGVGGRCDVFNAGSSYPTLLELDMSSAYLAHCHWLPSGTAHLFQGGHTFPYVTYFAKCIVTIPHELALGPFPVRTGRKDGKIVYPTLPGKYTAYLWKDQIQDCREAGCEVKVENGVGWEYLTRDMLAYSRFMHNARVYLDGTSIERDSKKIAVAGLGHFGMSSSFYRLTSDDNQKDACLVTKAGQPLSYYVREYADYTRPQMHHWFNYFIMQTARTLYKYALPYAVEGRLIMTNYDALIILERDERQRYARKHSLEALMAQAGDLRWQELTNVTILGERSLKCDQKITRPGVEKVQVEI